MVAHAASDATEVVVVSASARVDPALERLQCKKMEWVQLPLGKKIELLKAVRGRLLDNLVSWGKAGACIRGTANHESSVAGEMLGNTVMPAVYINKLMYTLETIQATGRAPQVPMRTLANGQKAVTVFPVTSSDRNNLLLPGASAELYLLPEQQELAQARLYTEGPGHDGKVCAVLGAGNQGFLSIKDALYCLYERGEVVALKPHPIMAAWQPYADYVLQPLVQAGYVATLHLPSVEETQALVYSDKLDCVHITGGTATHDAIVWGASPEERAARRAAGEPLLRVPISSELGCITPCMVAPAEFTPSQLKAQALSVVEGMMNNNSCNCNSIKVLVLPQDWRQAPAFLEEIRAALRVYPKPPPYYPGIQQRYAAFKSRYPNAEVIDSSSAMLSSKEGLGPPLPYLLNIMDELPEEPAKEYAFNVEPFAPVLTVVNLPTSGPKDFLKAAATFANESLWGTLSCTVVLHPSLEQQYPQEVAQVLQDLRYGVVAVNTWSALSFVVGPAPWGAFAGDQTIADVGSGIGLAGNSYMVEGVQKTVYRVPIEGAAVPKPMSVQPIPPILAKLICGYFVNGFLGIWRALIAAK